MEKEVETPSVREIHGLLPNGVKVLLGYVAMTDSEADAFRYEATEDPYCTGWFKVGDALFLKGAFIGLWVT